MNKTKDNSEIVYETIKKEIIDATRKPGDIFNEKEFAANMGISRTPVREAVLRLSNEGLLVVMPRRGTFVSHISMADVRDMYQVRKILEPQIAYIAAQKCDKDIVKQWRNFFKEEKTTGKSHSKDYIHPGNKTLDVYSDSDALFHIFIAECTGNKLLISQVEELMTLTQRIRCLTNAVMEDRFLSAVAEHIAITKALTASDSDGAAKAMLVHLENSEKGYSGITQLDFTI